MQANDTDHDLAANDLGPLAWVLDELRKSLESASAALRRFVRDAGLARGTDMASVDAGQLRIARQQLHQAVGALEMVGQEAPAHVLRSMETVVQKFVERPELCSEPAAAKVERAGFALAEYLEGVLLGKPVSAVGLFPQYRDIQELSGADRVHPADLWTGDWRWVEPETPATAQALGYEPPVRARLDQAVLRIVKSGDAAAARELTQTCLSLAAGQQARQPRIFWKLCAGFFEALALGLLPHDVYVKRAGSRVLLQYATLAKGDSAVSDRLAQDLVFFCAQAVPAHAADAPALTGVRLAWSLNKFKPVEYLTAQYGRFDPVLLAQARKRIATAKETWSALSGGETGKIKSVADQFHLVSDSLGKLHPSSTALAQALSAAVDGVARSAQPPRPELAMEVATAVLYLEAAFEDLDPSDGQLGTRTNHLAERLDKVRKGGRPEALEPWMEELYRRVSDRQTMGSVVGELRTTMSELEKVLDAFFRNPEDKAPLKGAPGHLSQMRGVLSVLGLDQAAHAVLRMRDSVEAIIISEGDGARARDSRAFDKLGNNLGALGFLIDMLNYQPTLAKKLFVYDDAVGELRPLMGRVGPAVPQASVPIVGRKDAPAPAALSLSPQEAAPPLPEISFTVPPVAAPAKPAAAPAKPAAAPAPVASAPADDGDDGELLDIFLEEAREVVQNGLAAIDALGSEPGDMGELTTLRRAFHTLKGSSRMVGLTEFGDAGWAMEQVLNAWLADQKPASPQLLALSAEAMRGFGRWADDIAAKQDGRWKSAMFRGPADAFRTEQRLLSLNLPGDAPSAVPQAAAGGAAGPVPEKPAPQAPVPAPQPVTAAPKAPAPAQLPPLADFDFAKAPVPPVPPAPVQARAGAAGAAPAAALEVPLEWSLDATQPMTLEAAIEGAEVIVAELPADFDFDFPAPGPAPAVPAPVTAEIESIDFTSLAALSGSAELPEPTVPALAEMLPMDEASTADEQVKVIGSLRIGIPLYNVYLNEADEWSRRLVTEVSEWSLELNQRVPDSTVGLAHALAGSSATVGFHALSDIARALEAALQQTQSLAYGTPQHGRTFLAAAEEIRRLLHQFAAGFLKEPETHVAQALHALHELDVPQRTDLPAVHSPSSGFGGLVPAPKPSTPKPAAPPKAAAPVPAPAAPAVRPAPAAAAAVAVAPAARSVPVVNLQDEEDQLDIADAVDVDLFPIFEEEAVELMPVLGSSLRQWSTRPDGRGARDEVLRALHTLKGSARLAGALRLGEMAHRMESAIEQFGGEAVSAADIEPLLHRFDSLQAAFDQLRATGGQVAVEERFEPAPPVQARVPAPAPAAPAVNPPVQPVPAQPAAAQPAPAQPRPPAAASAQRAVLAMPVTTQLAPQRAAASQAVRVRSQLLDRLVNQAGEVMITRSRLETELRHLRGSLGDLSGNLDRLRTQLRDIELQAESQMQSRLAQSKDSAAGFDPLEFDRFTRVQELTRMMAESVNDVATVQRNLQRTVEATEDDLIAQARQTRELQRDLLRTRMVEFEGISERLYRVVRLASKETGKQVKLDITGGSIEMDRGVLDRMTPAFEHLLRNCVAHGIEEPQARVAAGKDPVGTIVIHLHHEGNDVSVEFQDDGAGLNIARIRDKALQQGLIRPDQQITDQDAANLIFMPGFSTAAQVTELAGRGIGMDVVRSEVNALGGRIETSTRPGQGTGFKLVLPLTTAVTQVVMVRTGKLSIGVPANVVEVVRRASTKEVQQAYNSGRFEHAGEQVPFFWSGALLQASQRSTEPQGKTMPVVVFRSAAQRVAVHVDEVLGNQEVVVKNLGPQLARLPGLAGMTVLASGAVVLIYNPVALSAVYGEQARLLSADHAQPHVLEKAEKAPAAGGLLAIPAPAAPPQVPLVLVVDDSITVRRVTQRLLAREGYRVAMAADGLQALERLAEERPAVVLSDIEMPRMDGFDLARNIRSDERWAGLPIIMITSRIAEKHREHAKTLGVNHYLGKPYSEEELLSLIKHHCSASLAA
ncbi:hybrid sensor histidine kinase/response regulator [Ramlibacter tataouinensis]|uniref:Chemotaxis protein CheA n=1 Tax=Ramlibacter tataouinensis (strain ATCC BAA-407 / DSM 14655 / LMG 21543 / TTB310) TaxID=365046 RepID=F5XZG9_RAMTT|nr:Hpt domain-containing protein [Ramlibacter tataouinensis]AEG94526.1 candidate histidine kinase, CheA [Ramlibacter tataouinensis TTB310]